MQVSSISSTRTQICTLCKPTGMVGWQQKWSQDVAVLEREVRGRELNPPNPPSNLAVKERSGPPRCGSLCCIPHPCIFPACSRHLIFEWVCTYILPTSDLPHSIWRAWKDSLQILCRLIAPFCTRFHLKLYSKLIGHQNKILLIILPLPAWDSWK